MTAKRPLSNSSLAGDLPDPTSVSLPNPSHQLKKIKADVDNTSGQDPAAIITDPFQAELRSAINIKKALDTVHWQEQLGYCPTKVQQFWEDFAHDEEHDPYAYGEESPEKKFRSRDLANQAILDELGTVYEDAKSLFVSHTCGTISPFYLRISRPGCEYDNEVEEDCEDIEPLLHTWFEHSAISGYGDMQSLETKVDSEVRHAREIPASEFEVEPKFLKEIQELWGEHFLPQNVRAEPYKIHLYGPGGHFKSHRDTPETGLVGTFLVGLGDTSSTAKGNFRVADKTLRAEPCSWVAFHPDTPHEVTKLEDGYRAVIAFKIFRVADNEPDVSVPELEARIKGILDQIQVPFGLFTTHQYSMGTISLNGFDTLLLTYARSRKDTKARMLPVVTQFEGEAFDSDMDPREYESSARSRVYPFSGSHVDILLKKNVFQAKKDVRWLEGLSDIPFYTWDIQASLETWKEDHPQGSNYIGNEADSSREDSVYLSYAILFLPQTHDVRV